MVESCLWDILNLWCSAHKGFEVVFFCYIRNTEILYVCKHETWKLHNTFQKNHVAVEMIIQKSLWDDDKHWTPSQITPISQAYKHDFYLCDALQDPVIVHNNLRVIRINKFKLLIFFMGIKRGELQPNFIQVIRPTLICLGSAKRCFTPVGIGQSSSWGLSTQTASV